MTGDEKWNVPRVSYHVVSMVRLEEPEIEFVHVEHYLQASFGTVSSIPYKNCAKKVRTIL